MIDHYNLIEVNFSRGLMNKIQIRYFQIVLIVGLIVSEFISSSPLMYSSLFGLTGVWFYESITSQNIFAPSEKSQTIFIGLLTYFFVVLFYQNSEKISSWIYLIVILILLVLFITLAEISVDSMGKFLLYYTISLSTVIFIFSDDFYLNRELIVWSFLAIFLLENIAMLISVQYSNSQYYFKFFLVFVAVMGVSVILSNSLLNSLVASLGLAVFTVLLNDLILKLRIQITSNKNLDTQIYIHDYLISLLGAFYLTNFTSTYIGLF